MLYERRRRAPRPRHELPAAIRAAAGQHAVGAACAEGAFEGADARLRRVRRQRSIATLAGRSQFEHDGISEDVIHMLVQPPPGGPQLHYRRHFVLLGLVSAVLVIPGVAKSLYALGGAPAWHGISGFDALFALCGFLHALIVAVSLRAKPPLWRPLVFIAGASFLNLCVLHLGFFIVSLEAGAVATGPAILVSACVGACAYASLTRLLLRFRLVFIALAPVACLFGSLAGTIGAHFASNFMVLTIAWWFAFSAWLYGADQWPTLAQRARADAAKRRVS
jgi:hypothetical protein